MEVADDEVWKDIAVQIRNPFSKRALVERSVGGAAVVSEAHPLQRFLAAAG